MIGKGCECCAWPLVLELETDLVRGQGMYSYRSYFVWLGVSFVSNAVRGHWCLNLRLIWLENRERIALGYTLYGWEFHLCPLPLVYALYVFVAGRCMLNNSFI